MAQVPGVRAVHLNNYFSAQYGYEPERYLAGNIIYKHTTPQNEVRRIVVKHAVLPLGVLQGAAGRDDEIDTEEEFLRKLWGSEHNIRLLSIVRDQRHSGTKWRVPRHRRTQNPPPILPWSLPIDPQAHGNLDFAFFVMEYLPRGTGSSLIERCQALGIPAISEALLWYFFLCLTRACVGMLYPPNVSNRNPRASTREKLPAPGRRATALCHYDLHVENMMFGDYDSRDIQPPCHQVIDFGLAESDGSIGAAQAQNMLNVGELMHQLARVELDPVVDNRPMYRATGIPGHPDFYTYATASFCRSHNYSYEFKSLVALCMAALPADRPVVEPVLRQCERHVASIGNWRRLADEVSEIFDDLTPRDDDSSDDDYVP
ncbi:hypothetical protein F5Y12DRAFT_710660 [Xylaria sp. FL1777]|nr:hypothetical protein F5Y12DRAFT_710660 [Xylaria sp. FL1777]